MVDRQRGLEHGDRRNSLRGVLVHAVRQVAGQPAAPAQRAIRRLCRQGASSRSATSLRSASIRRARHDGAAEHSFYGTPWLIGMIGAGRSPARPCRRPVPPACASSSPARTKSRWASPAPRWSSTATVARTARICLPGAQRPGWNRRARGLGAGQFLQRAARWSRHAEHGGERRAQAIGSRPPSSTIWCCAAYEQYATHWPTTMRSRSAT